MLKAGDDPACAAVATARAQDGRYNGYSPAMQKAIYTQSYQQCLQTASKTSLVATPLGQHAR